MFRLHFIRTIHAVILKIKETTHNHNNPETINKIAEIKVITEIHHHLRYRNIPTQTRRGMLNSFIKVPGKDSLSHIILNLLHIQFLNLIVHQVAVATEVVAVAEVVAEDKSNFS